MASWTSGYVAELGYGHDFNAELTPELLRFVGLVRGIRAPDPGALLSYCELGCGQGFSSNLLAAANPQIQFHAVDFNPVHIASAQAFARCVGTPNVCFHELAFADLEMDPALPARFDVIGLHGVYSWISNENRAHIVNFLRRRLRPGGLAYISYNAMPGWAAKLPLRRLMADHAASREGPLSARIDAAVGFVERLRGVSPSYFTHNPRVMADFDKFKGMARSYLAHEYFNRDLTAFHFADVATDLAEAKLDFVGSVDLLDHIDAIHLSPEQQTFLAEIPCPINREGLRDLIVEQVFRRDLFVKGAVPHDALSLREAWLDQSFVLSTARENVEFRIAGARGEAALQADIYEPILDGFADGAQSLRDIYSLPALKGIDWPRLLQAITVLVGASYIQPCPPPTENDVRAERCRAFNAVVCEHARGSAALSALASPITGGGVPVDRISALFLLARMNDHPDPAEFAWSCLSALGQALSKDGVKLRGAEENLHELRSRWEGFKKQRLPTLGRDGVTTGVMRQGNQVLTGSLHFAHDSTANGSDPLR